MVVQIPDVELVTIADAGHLVTLEQPEAASRAVERLLERISPPDQQEEEVTLGGSRQRRHLPGSASHEEKL
jgi:hypothetical protein